MTTLIALLVSSPLLVSGPQDPAPLPPGTHPDRRRILHLEDGDVLRERSRCLEGHWQVRDGREWIELDRAVERHRLEKDVIAEARAMELALAADPEADDPGAADARRVDLARWMLDQGLSREAGEQLDRVLEVEPDHPRALALLTDGAFALELPGDPRVGSVEWQQALLRTGAGGTPAVRELCARELAVLSERPGFDELLASVCQHGNPNWREFGFYTLRRLERGQHLERLSTHAILDPMRGVREQAALGLRAADDPAVVGPAVRALASQHEVVRAHAAEALGTMGYPAAVEPLVKRLSALRDPVARRAADGHPGGTRSNLFAGTETAYVLDYDVEIAQGASIADPIVGTVRSGVVFDVRAQAQITRVVEWQAVVGALGKITKAKVPDRPDAWLRWWDQNGSAWRMADHLPPRDPEGSEAALEARAPDGR